MNFRLTAVFLGLVLALVAGLFVLVLFDGDGDGSVTADGLMAYTGVRLGQEQAADFTPVASYPGLTAAVRAKLGEMKVAPVTAEIADDTSMPASDTATSVAPVTTVPKSPGPRDKRAALN